MCTAKLGTVVMLLAASGPWAVGRCAEPAPVSRPRADLYGDPLPPGALARMGTIRYAHGDSTDGPPVLAPDHKTFATVSRHTPYGVGRAVCLWDAASGKELRHFDDPDFEPFQVFYLKTENLLVTLGVSREPVKSGEYAYAVQFWDPATGKQTPGSPRVMADPFVTWALSPDESCLAGVTRKGLVVVCDRKTGKTLAEWKGDDAPVRFVAFSPDGNTVVVGGKTILLWSWNGGKKDRVLVYFPDGLERLWFSPDGRWIATAHYKEGVRVWDAAGLIEVRRFPGEHNVRFFPDGDRLVSLDTGVVRDVASGKPVGQFEDCAHCLALDFSADGKEAMGYALGRVRFWDPITGKDHSPPAPAVPDVMIHQIGFLPGGKEVVSASPDGAVRVWDAATGKELRTLIRGTMWDPQKTPPTFMRVALDGTIIVAHGDRLSFFKGEGKAEEFRLTGFPAGLESLNLSPDGKTLLVAAAVQDKTLMEVWDVAARKVVTHFVAPAGTLGVTAGLTNDRRIVVPVYGGLSLLDAAGSISRTLMDRPADGGGATGYFYGIQALTFSPDGDLLASTAPAGGGLNLLDAVTGKPRCTLPGRHIADLFNAVFSPDGRMVAAESEEGVVDVWETSTGRRRRRFLGHRSYQTTLAFSPDGTKLASGNRDGTILIWDVFGKFAGDEEDAGPLAEAQRDALWTRLGDADAEPACQAMGRLMRHPDESGPYLKRRVLGRKGPETAQLRRRIADLDDDDFEVREAASAELAKWLPSAAPLVKAALANHPSPESRRRLEELQVQWERRGLPAATIRDLRALEVLESFGPAASKEVERELAEGNYDPWVAAAAKAARRLREASSP